MKPQHNLVFNIVKKKIIDNNISISLFYIEKRTNKVIGGELIIEQGNAFINLDNGLISNFKTLNFKELYNTIESRYREQWKNAYDEVDEAIKTKKRVRLNPICSGFFGPYFNPAKKSQSYNIYTSLYFKIKEIEKLNIALDKLYRKEKIYISPDEYISIDDLSNIIYENDNNIEKIQQNELIEQKLDNNKNDDENLDTLKLKKIELKNFVCFNNIEQNFCEGINLIIGKNSSGKTLLMKFLYGTIKSLETYNKAKITRNNETFKDHLNNKLYNVYKEPEKGIGTLVSKNVSDKKLDITITLGDKNKNENINLSFGEKTTKEIVNVKLSEFLDYENTNDIVNLFNTIFIPSKEILGIYRAVKFTVNQQRIDFDDTYFDLANSIELSSVEQSSMQDIIKELERIINGKIEFNIKENKFVYKSENQTYEMPMTAEGVKQIGVIITLLKNRELRENTILFLDEPDTNLNPESIRPFVKILIELAKKDIQIIITSHNYFMLKQLGICAKQNKNVPIHCYSLLKNPQNSKTDIEFKDMKFGLPNYNPIVQEALDMFNEDIIANFS